MNKNTIVTISTFVIAGLGILSFIILPGRKPLFGGRWAYEVSAFLAPMDLSFFRKGRAVNLLFHLLFILGGILFANDNKKTHLLRFLFAILLLSNLGDILSGLLRIVFPLPLEIGGKLNVFLFILGYAINIVYIAFSYYILSLLKKNHTLTKVAVEGTQPVIYEFKEISMGIRFLHLLLDYLICVIVFSKITSVFAYGGYVERLAHIMGIYGALSLFILVFRIGYYILCESVLEATPAKFLTGSRVSNEKGDRPDLLQIIGRSFARFVPFNNLSFLFRGNWHDSWSKTKVYKETIE